MRNRLYFLGLTFMSFATMLISCGDDTPVVESKDTVTVSLTTQNNKQTDVWVYFSFDTNSEVSNIDSSNYKTSDKWDIAFHSRHVRLNGGTSGQGDAEAYDAGIVDFNSITKAPGAGYAKDTFVDNVLYAGMGESGPILVGTNLNSVFENAFTYDQNTHPPTYSASMHVYVIKTRTGKFVKILLTDYYNDKGESGYVTFKYQFGKDVTGNF
jgi:hypothetical protein